LNLKTPATEPDMLVALLEVEERGEKLGGQMGKFHLGNHKKRALGGGV